MNCRAALALSAALSAGAAAALPGPPRPEHEVNSQELVYRLPGMERATIRRDVPFKTFEGGRLALDLYYPADFREGAPRPAVLFINGVGDRPGNALKSWKVYESWARLVAASGWIGVLPEARGPYRESGPDIRDAFAFLRSDGARLGIDTGRIAAWVCSGNVASGLPVLMEGPAGVLGAVVYYGDAELSKIRTDFPVYFVRAGRDSPRLNAGIEELWSQAVAAGAPWTMVNAPQSHHAFDVLDETGESRRIVKETLEFYRDLFAPVPAPGPPSAARKALSHWFGGREYPEAARAYAEYVRTHPDDAVAYLRLGLSQAHAGQAAEADASLQRAAALGADSAIDLYNIACGYARLGRTDAALDALDRAVKAGFRDRRLMETDDDLASVRDDDRFRRLLAQLGD